MTKSSKSEQARLALEDTVEKRFRRYVRLSDAEAEELSKATGFPIPAQAARDGLALVAAPWYQEMWWKLMDFATEEDAKNLKNPIKTVSWLQE